MRWERLFADAVAQLDAATRLELEDEIAVRTRAERKNIRLEDRLRVVDGQAIDVHVLGPERVRGVLREIGPDWFLLAEQGGAEILVPTASVLVIGGLREGAAAPRSEGSMVAMLTFRHALTVICSDRSHTIVSVADGSRLEGTVDRVGADAFDLTPRVRGEGGRPSAPSVVVPFAAVGMMLRR
ncbi:hypothetical protein EF847_04455 [Actinobacteria bacterium YIM 96077]|uniref:Fis family transcriptional regulator n=1 Tax=Phytoactinopolyspora halophila TaxID=1981511 RepID=A0A329R2U7_9ACTN|nr:hypothetical protein [Phytoactinopolyspora halophila]AYY12073.1 hypothetical protein EF847_04455 [Actinobacteria bacterium YIM 96077]RAW18693.1 hypothetical protein DPM12_01055 [Phytoactinopolyspora halophila]